MENTNTIPNENKAVKQVKIPVPVAVAMPRNIPRYSGRHPIYTDKLPKSISPLENMGDEYYLNESTILEVLDDAMRIHETNVAEMTFLYDYYFGKRQLVDRERDTEKLVNNVVILNYCIAITRNINGYTYGTPVKYVQRKGEKQQSVTLLNDYMAVEDKDLIDKMNGNDSSIVGTSYRGVFPNKSALSNTVSLDDTPFEIIYYNPRTTFVIYSAYNPSQEVMAVSYILSKDGLGKETITYYCYTNETQFVVTTNNTLTIDATNATVTTKSNTLGLVPIVEYQNNEFRMGDWEFAISIMEAINNLASDSINDVEQTVISYLALFGVELTEEKLAEIKKHKIMAFPNNTPGIQQDAKFITSQIDGESVNKLRGYIEEALKFIIGIPDRKTKSSGGGDTGNAVMLRDGWADMEIVATNKESFYKASDRKTLRVIMEILRKMNIITDLSVADIDIKFNRNKTDNLATKVQAFAGLMNTEVIDPVDALTLVDVTTDENEIVKRGLLWRDSIKQETLDQEKATAEINKPVETTTEVIETV